MAEPVLPDHVVGARRWLFRFSSAPGMLWVVLELALALRVLAAEAIEWYVRRGGPDRLCLFGDTKIYWELARAIRADGPYQIVYYGDIPHFALRTPGYPVVLAGCQALFGEQTLAVRLVQALFGTCGVYFVYRLSCQLVARNEPEQLPRPELAQAPAEEPRAHRDTARGTPSEGRTLPLVAAALAAFNPYYIIMSAILLSEAIFVPLMLAALWGLAVLWPRPVSSAQDSTLLSQRAAGRWVAGREAALISLFGGMAAGMAVLVRPSWALFVPGALAVWVLALLRARRFWDAARGATLWLCGAVIVCCPWWLRNAQVYGRFVPTALWLGASLYDGLNPQATGASDMTFLSDPEVWPLDEQDQDAALFRRAVQFVAENPKRTLVLAIVKLGRFWSPWPNAEGFGSWPLMVAGAAVELPILGLLGLGVWNRRRDLCIWVVSAGPILYFSALHLMFASSMRYRIPGEMPALALAAIGWSTLWSWWRRLPPRPSEPG